MNKLIFPLEDNSYDIELSKEKRIYGFSKFGNYICKMSFLDKVGLSHVDVTGTEKQFFDFMNLLNEINTYPYENNVNKDTITFFTAGNTSMFIYVSCSSYNSSPSEEDDKVYIQIFEDTIYGRLSRLYIEFNFYFLEEFIYNLYQLLEDINYLPDIGYSSLLDIMGEYEGVIKKGW